MNWLPTITAFDGPELTVEAIERDGRRVMPPTSAYVPGSAPQAKRAESP